MGSIRVVLAVLAVVVAIADPVELLAGIESVGGVTVTTVGGLLNDVASSCANITSASTNEWKTPVTELKNSITKVYCKGE